MSTPNKTGLTSVMVLIFIVAPALLCVLGEAPPRSWLKDFLSLLTILAFSLLLGQVYLSRVQEDVLNRHPNLARIIRIHKALGCFSWRFSSCIQFSSCCRVISRQTSVP